MIYFTLEIKMVNNVNTGDQNSQQVVQNPINQSTITQGKSRVNFWIISTIVLLLTLVLTGYYVYRLGANTTSLKVTKPEPSFSVSTNKLEETLPSSTPTNKIESPTGWKRAENLSLVSFDYPIGWHVSSSWSTDYKGPVTIVLDPEPLNGAPRGGPTTAIMIKDYSGIDNPEEQLNKNLEESKKNIVDIKETKFIVGSTTFYKLEGRFNLYNEMVPILLYHALLKGQNTNNINTHVIWADLTHYRDNDDHKKYVEILDRLIRSMRHKDEK